MLLKDFEKLRLQYLGRICIVNNKGEKCWGRYLGEYDPVNSTFKFYDSGLGAEKIIRIEKIQMITGN